MSKARLQAPPTFPERLAALRIEYEEALARAPEPLDAPTPRAALAARQYRRDLQATWDAAATTMQAADRDTTKYEEVARRLQARRADLANAEQTKADAETALETLRDPPIITLREREIASLTAVLPMLAAEISRLEWLAGDRHALAEAARQKAGQTLEEWRGLVRPTTT